MKTTFTIENISNLESPMNQNHQFSPRMMEILQGVSIDGDVEKLKLFSSLVLTLISLGYREHSGDWDPYLEINLYSGILLRTEPGYWEINFKDEHTVQVYREIPFDEDQDEFPDIQPVKVNIPIASIKTISIDTD